MYYVLWWFHSSILTNLSQCALCSNKKRFLSFFTDRFFQMFSFCDIFLYFGAIFMNNAIAKRPVLNPYTVNLLYNCGCKVKYQLASFSLNGKDPWHGGVGPFDDRDFFRAVPSQRGQFNGLQEVVSSRKSARLRLKDTCQSSCLKLQRPL